LLTVTLFKDGGINVAGTRQIILPELIGAVYGIPVTIAQFNGSPLS
jgi:hypothetical protein